MSHRHPHLSVVEPHPDGQRDRSHAPTGREPNTAELTMFARWKVTVGLGLPLTTRRSAARFITRF